MSTTTTSQSTFPSSTTRMDDDDDGDVIISTISTPVSPPTSIMGQEAYAEPTIQPNPSKEVLPPKTNFLPSTSPNTSSNTLSADTTPTDPTTDHTTDTTTDTTKATTTTDPTTVTTTDTTPTDPTTSTTSTTTKPPMIIQHSDWEWFDRIIGPRLNQTLRGLHMSVEKSIDGYFPKCTDRPSLELLQSIFYVGKLDIKCHIDGCHYVSRSLNEFRDIHFLAELLDTIWRCLVVHRVTLQPPLTPPSSVPATPRGVSYHRISVHGNLPMAMVSKPSSITPHSSSSTTTLNQHLLKLPGHPIQWNGALPSSNEQSNLSIPQLSTRASRILSSTTLNAAATGANRSFSRPHPHPSLVHPYHPSTPLTRLKDLFNQTVQPIIMRMLAQHRASMAVARRVYAEKYRIMPKFEDCELGQIHNMNVNCFVCNQDLSCSEFVAHLGKDIVQQVRVGLLERGFVMKPDPNEATNTYTYESYAHFSHSSHSRSHHHHHHHHHHHRGPDDSNNDFYHYYKGAIWIPNQPVKKKEEPPLPQRPPLTHHTINSPKKPSKRTVSQRNDVDHHDNTTLTTTAMKAKRQKLGEGKNTSDFVATANTSLQVPSDQSMDDITHLSNSLSTDSRSTSARSRGGFTRGPGGRFQYKDDYESQSMSDDDSEYVENEGTEKKVKATKLTSERLSSRRSARQSTIMSQNNSYHNDQSNDIAQDATTVAYAQGQLLLPQSLQYDQSFEQSLEQDDTKPRLRHGRPSKAAAAAAAQEITPRRSSRARGSAVVGDDFYSSTPTNRSRGLDDDDNMNDHGENDYVHGDVEEDDWYNAQEEDKVTKKTPPGRTSRLKKATASMDDEGNMSIPITTKAKRGTKQLPLGEQSVNDPNFTRKGSGLNSSFLAGSSQPPSRQSSAAPVDQRLSGTMRSHSWLPQQYPPTQPRSNDWTNPLRRWRNVLSLQEQQLIPSLFAHFSQSPPEFYCIICCCLIQSHSCNDHLALHRRYLSYPQHQDGEQEKVMFPCGFCKVAFFEEIHYQQHCRSRGHQQLIESRSEEQQLLFEPIDAKLRQSEQKVFVDVAFLDGTYPNDRENDPYEALDHILYPPLAHNGTVKSKYLSAMLPSLPKIDVTYPKSTELAPNFNERINPLFSPYLFNISIPQDLSTFSFIPYIVAFPSCVSPMTASDAFHKVGFANVYTQKWSNQELCALKYCTVCHALLHANEIDDHVKHHQQFFESIMPQQTLIDNPNRLMLSKPCSAAIGLLNNNHGQGLDNNCHYCFTQFEEGSEDQHLQTHSHRFNVEYHQLLRSNTGNDAQNDAIKSQLGVLKMIHDGAYRYFKLALQIYLKLQDVNEPPLPALPAPNVLTSSTSSFNNGVGQDDWNKVDDGNDKPITTPRVSSRASSRLSQKH